MLNLSRGGICVTLSTAIAPGTEVEMEFVTVDRHGKANKRRLRGMVAWRRTSRHGISFRERGQFDRVDKGGHGRLALTPGRSSSHPRR